MKKKTLDQPGIDKIYLYVEGPYKAKYQFLVKRESTGLNHFSDSKAFIKYSSNKGNIYKNIERHNPNKKHRILICFDHMITDMFSTKKTWSNSNWVTIGL